VIAPGQQRPERLVLRQRDTLLALEAYVDRLAAHVADLQALLRRSRRRTNSAIERGAGEGGAGEVTGPDAGAPQHVLVDRRRALGLSQRAVARAAGYSRSEVSELERGKRRSPEALKQCAAALERLEHEARWRRTGLAGPTGPAPRPAAPPEALS
jgi:hypothetical protein